MSEFAIVSARRSKLQADADAGNGRALKALALAESPEQFLATVQAGITLIGIIAGVYGGATLGEDLTEFLSNSPEMRVWISPLSYAAVVLLITYLSLVVGELVPKRLALGHSEAIARGVAPIMMVFSRLFRPLVSLLTWSSDHILRLFPLVVVEESNVTEDEIEMMIEQGADEGVFEEIEGRMLRKVLRLADKPVSAAMTPRNEIIWLDAQLTVEAAWKEIEHSDHLYFPVGQGAIDNLLGEISLRTMSRAMISDRSQLLEQLMTPALLVPSTSPMLSIIELFKDKGHRMAVLIDEYGGVDGLVTMADILKALVGEVETAEGESTADGQFVRRDDGSYLADATMDIDALFDSLALELSLLPEHKGYHSLGGFVMQHLQRVPRAADSFNFEGFRFEVVDMDANRIDKVLIAALPPETHSETDQAVSNE